MGLYTEKFVILAFKFKAGVKPNKRKLRYYYKIMLYSIIFEDISCNYEGVCSSGGKKVSLGDFGF